jgi:hypothetical protein
MNTFAQLVFKNNAFIINNELLKKKNMDLLIGWIVKKFKNSY